MTLEAPLVVSMSRMLLSLGRPRHANFLGKIRSGRLGTLSAISMSSAQLTFGSHGLLSSSVSMLARQNRRAKHKIEISSTNKGPN